MILDGCHLLVEIVKDGDEMTRSSGRYVSVVVVTVECHIHTRPPSLCFRIICNSRRCSKTQEQEIRDNLGGNVTLALITAVSLDSFFFMLFSCAPRPRLSFAPSLLPAFLYTTEIRGRERAERRMQPGDKESKKRKK
jgi:hypothetical protein